jgi:autotransporter-associated beta strand protein
MRKIKIITLFLLLLSLQAMNAQRQMEHLDRGVVAVNRGGGKLFISWRYFATDSEDIAFNVYRQIGYGTPVKLNPSPITGATNYTWTISGAGLTVASRVYVKPVINGVEGDEEGSWSLTANMPAGRIVRDYLYEPFPAGYPDMTMKYCWPADLNGDGKYDFVIDRHPSASSGDGGDEVGEVDVNAPVHIDAYKDDGTFLWRINMGNNVITSNGHNDMVTAYDMDGDNKAEVLMAVSEGTTFADRQVIKNADGTVHDYNSVAGSAPQWVAIVNGETGVLIDTIGLSRFDSIPTTRTDKWKHIAGHFIIAYLDGIHPSLIYQYKNRIADGRFTGAYGAWSYRNGELVEEWSRGFYRNDVEYEAHQVRVADVDGDGKDEFVEISYVIDDDGSMLYKVDNVAHGDRHCLTDIDPDRPGLEQFFVQQTNIMGMGLFDAVNGTMIKGIYLSAVADIGRGICAAFDPNRRGLQFFAVMQDYQMYDCKANRITGAKGMFPSEALWWGSNLARRQIGFTGDDKNPVIDAYNTTSKTVGREVTLYRASESGAPRDYYFQGANAGRAAFWGDLLGDWREELIYARGDKKGFVILSTWDETAHRQYCLMQNPGYRCQTTARGYYQTADVDFYMAADMPQPPVAPVQKADVYLTGNTLTSAVANGKSVMLDIRNPNTSIALNENITPTRLWLMNPKGKNVTIGGAGKLTGATDVVKSQQGDVTLNGNHDYAGVTRISEGRLFVNGALASLVRVDARGVIGGNATLNGGIVLETGLNVEGGRIEPGNGADLGTLTIAGNLSLPGRNNLAFDIDQTQAAKNDQLVIQGDFTVTDSNHSLVINPLTTPQSATLTLITFTGTTNATETDFSVKGLEGVPYNLIVEANAIKIEIVEPRPAGSVVWKGEQSAVWDFRTENFVKETTGVVFVPGDVVTFNDDAVSKTITINETMPVNGLTFANNADYSISGQGIISGTSGLNKTGTGKVSLLTEENSFTGSIDFADGVLEVSSLKDGGLPSSIGASAADASNWIMRNATLQTTSQMATNRNMTVVGKLTVNNPTANNSVAITGNITGSNISLELSGNGMLNLQGSNSFGNVTIKSGTLSLGSIVANKNGLGNAPVTLEGGTLQMLNSNTTSNVGPWTNTIDVPEGKSAKWNLPQRWNFTNKLTGKGALTINVPNDLTGIVYVKFSSYNCTRGTGYFFINSEGNTVFAVGSNNNTGNNALRYSLTAPTASNYLTWAENVELNLGNANAWNDWELVLDLTASKVIALKAVYNGTASAIQTNITLDNATDISKFGIVTGRYNSAGLDNITIGQLLADKITDITGEAELQTLSTQVDKTYSVTALASVESLSITDLEVPGGNSDITWSISDYGLLSEDDKNLVSLIRSETNHAIATLSTTGIVSANATITIKAACGEFELTKEVELKAASVDGLKATLSDEISAATTLNDTRTAENPYLSGVKAILSGVISSAQTVYDNTSATSEAISSAIANLQAAEAAFTAALLPYDNYVAYIATIQAAHDAEERTQTFFTAIKATLQSAITAATTAKGNIENTDDIATATSTLAAALAAFNAAIPYYTSLEAAIVSTTTSYNAAYARVGTKFLNYRSTDVEALNTAIATAQTALSASTTVEDLDDAKTALENALNAARIAPGEIQYKIYTYGESNNTTPSTKKTLYVDNSGETPALKSIVVADITEDIADEWRITEIAPNQYNIQNSATDKYLTVVGLSDSPVTISLPETKASSENIISIDEGYFFYCIKAGNNYLRQRNADLALNSYSMDLGRFDTSFQFEEYSGATVIIAPDANDSLVTTKYYNLQGQQISVPTTGAYIVKQIYESGKTTTEKQIKIK